MSTIDPRGHALSGCTPASLAAYEDALAAFLSWRSGTEALIEHALALSPGFVMAHVLKACTMIGSRDPRRVRAAQPVLAAATALRANEHERLHLAAVARVLADDYPGAAALFAQALQSRPRDLLALAMACGIDYLTGEATRLQARVEGVLPAWPSDLPGYQSVLAMRAFGLVECGEHERAEDAALAALALDEGDARAHHAMAHVFEMSDRPAAGIRWLERHAPAWSRETVVATHGAWHLALFHLAQGEPAAALDLYDRRIRAGRSSEVADLIDASALLWRLHLQAVDTGPRWSELATAWEPHVDDGYCSFGDVHAMLAFVGAGDGARAQRLARVLGRQQALPTRHGLSTQALGLPACRGLMAFGRGEYALAITSLASLPARWHGLGGSHAQRDVLHLTLLRAIECMRRPARAMKQKKQDELADATRLPYPLPRFVLT